MTRLAVLLTCLIGLQTFRSAADAVSISASVKNGNAAVADLNPEDFRLVDNGVRQDVEVLTVESVPIDLTLFVDTSGSTAGALSRMRADVERMVRLLGPADRFRILTIGITVDETVPWTPEGGSFALTVRPVPGISLIYDALFAALLHRPDAGRRHLVVGLTDGDDCGSVIDGPSLLDASARTEAVLHILYAQAYSRGDFGLPATCTPLDPSSSDFIRKAAERTGGAFHKSLFGDASVHDFQRIVDEFKTSYVLRYSPRGVARAGWHAITVDVPGRPGVTVHARAGYFVDR